jgi:hypothetical protein
VSAGPYQSLVSATEPTDGKTVDLADLYDNITALIYGTLKTAPGGSAYATCRLEGSHDNRNWVGLGDATFQAQGFPPPPPEMHVMRAVTNRAHLVRYVRVNLISTDGDDTRPWSVVLSGSVGAK